MAKRAFNKSATRYVLEALIPYTESNLLLTFKPTTFFNELEKKDRRGNNTYRSAFSRAKRQDLIEYSDKGTPRLTRKGMAKIQPYTAKKLGENARLIVIFDIPENERHKRTQLRLLLNELSFKQIQKSVWSSDKDHRKLLKDAVKEYELKDYVKVIEAVEV
jgi:DNA-binding transcriptional regulator PaaX